MLSLIPSRFTRDVLPQDEWETLALYCREHQITDETPGNEIIRRFLLQPPTPTTAKLTTSSLALLTGCKPSNVSRQRTKIRAGKTKTVVVAKGRPSYLPEKDIELIRAQIREMISQEDFPSLRYIKELIWHHLEKNSLHFTPSKNYFQMTINTICGTEFNIRTAVPLEKERWELKKDDVREYFEVLRRLDFENIHPSLIVNIDEAGFGQSKSGRERSVKVLCSKSHVGPVSFVGQRDVHYVTAIAAITASGHALSPGLIIRRQTTHPDMLKLPFWRRSRVYSSPKAFISRKIFEDFIRSHVCHYIEQAQRKLGKPESKAVLIMDGHKSHLTSALAAYLASLRIHLVFIPPHSSHVLQPCDQGYFRRVKQLFNGSAPVTGYAKIAAMLQRVSNAFQGANVDWVVLRSFSKTGLDFHVVDGEVTRIVLNSDTVLDGGEIHSSRTCERVRGDKINGGEWGLLNQDEMMLAEAGLCPFCCSVLGESRTATVPQERQQARPENRRLLRFNEGDESCDPEVVPQESFD